MSTKSLLWPIAFIAVLLAAASCEHMPSDVPAIEYSGEFSQGEWSTDPEFFHTEGDFKNGSLWQISSYGESFSYWTSDGERSRRIKLSGYFEALQLSEELKRKGYTCDYYDYSY